MGRMSFAILHTFFTRLQEQDLLRFKEEISEEFELVKRRGEDVFLKNERFTFVERPPMITVEQYRKKRRTSEESDFGAAR